MRVLVTGATGFVGGRLCELLAGSGHEVAALSRSPDAARRDRPVLSAAHAWSPLEEPAPGQAVEAADAVVHLAGESVAGRWTESKKKAIRESRLVGTRHLVQALAAADSRPSVLVSASAIGYYGDRGDEVLTEDSRPGDDFLADVCQGWEREALHAAEHGVRVVCLRTGIVLGEGGGALQEMLTPFKLGVGGPMGSGRQFWAWIHRTDLARIVEFALDRDDLEGPCNATAPSPRRQKEFARVLGKVLRRPAFLPTPAFALKIVLGGFSTELLSSRRVQPEKLEEAGFEFRHPELEEALREAL